MNQQFIIGVDGGGTKTVSFVIDRKKAKEILIENKTNKDNYVIGKNYGLATNPNSVTPEIARKNLLSCLDLSINDCKNLKPKYIFENLIGIGLGMSGVDRPKDKIMVMKWMKDYLEEKEKEFNFKPNFLKNKIKIRIENDSINSLYSGTLGQHKNKLNTPSFVVISGTGMITGSSICYKNNKDDKDLLKEKFYRSGGWGPLLGERGAGFWIGSQVLEVVCRTKDKIKFKSNGNIENKIEWESEMLKEEVIKLLNLKDITQIIPWVYNQRKGEYSKFGEIAPICFKCAKKGNKIAQKILDLASTYLTDYIDGLFNQMYLDEDKLIQKNVFEKNQVFMVFSGSILTHDNGEGIVAKGLKEKIMKKYPNIKFRFEIPSVEPVVGSACFYL